MKNFQVLCDSCKKPCDLNGFYEAKSCSIDSSSPNKKPDLDICYDCMKSICTILRLSEMGNVTL